MTHPYVTQLRFARSEFTRCLNGLSDEDARKRILPMNCISWIIGHLANQEHFYWCAMGQSKFVAPGLNDLVGFGKPATAPPLNEIWAVWQTVTETADTYLSSINNDDLSNFLAFNGKHARENIGTMLLRNIYHYWFHIGEAHAVRQQLGHSDLPQFVGRMDTNMF